MSSTQAAFDLDATRMARCEGRDSPNGCVINCALLQHNELICQKGNDEDCVFYNSSRFAVAAGIGAGLGALIGWIAGR